MITKSEVRKVLSDIKALDKASNILISDIELRNGLYLKMAKKMTDLIRDCINTRNLSEYEIKELEKCHKKIRNYITTDEYDEEQIFFSEEYSLHSSITSATIIIKVMVLNE